MQIDPALAPRRVDQHALGVPDGMTTAKKGKGSDTARRANAKAAKEGEENPRRSSAAQAELGRKGAKKRNS